MSSTTAKSVLKQRWQQVKHVFLRHKINLRPYQKYGIKWLIAKEALGNKGGLLTDEPGLGKTYQSLSIVLAGKGVSLVVVPASIIQQWLDDSKLLCGEDSVYLHHGTNRRTTIQIGRASCRERV